jgi:uncharacterized Fe-S radical SAM superfamily protein PflX
MLPRYHKILAGRATPVRRKSRLAAALKATAKSSAKCDLCPPGCGKKLREPAAILVEDWKAERELLPATMVCFESKTMDPFEPESSGKRVSAAKAAAALNKRTDRRGLIIYGDSHAIPAALDLASKLETKVPVVWAGQPWLSAKAMRLLKPLADAFLFNVPYFEDVCGDHIGEKPAYREAAMKTLKAAKGKEIILQIPVKPNHLECDARPLLDWIAKEIPNVSIKLLPHNKPMIAAAAHELSRTISIAEFDSIVKRAHELKLRT